MSLQLFLGRLQVLAQLCLGLFILGQLGVQFGATPGKRAQFETANVPGTEITFNKVEMPQAPTKGRSASSSGTASAPGATASARGARPSRT